MEYDFVIKYQNNVEHQAADELSWLPTKGYGWIRHQRGDHVDGCSHTRIEKANQSPRRHYRTDSHRDKEPYIPSLVAFMSVHRRDAYCDSTRSTVGVPGSCFTFDKNGLLVTHSPIDRFIQKVVPQYMCPIILRLAHPSTLAGHSGKRRMYETSWREYYSSNMSTDVYNTARNCWDCPGFGTILQYQRQLGLFPPSFALESRTIDPLGSLRWTKPGNQYVAVTTDRYITMTFEVPTITTPSMHVAYIIFNHG